MGRKLSMVRSNDIDLEKVSDERKYMTDQEILDKYIDLERSCLTEKEKKEVMEMLYKYKEAFSLRDEIGTCPNYRSRNRHYG